MFPISQGSRRNPRFSFFRAGFVLSRCSTIKGKTNMEQFEILRKPWRRWNSSWSLIKSRWEQAVFGLFFSGVKLLPATAG